ncbi:unnamed protein product [Musa acuminata subsp. burmannicoides]
MEFLRFGAEVAAGEEAATGYWMRWQTLVCALIVVAPAVAAVVVAARAPARPLRAVDLWAPCWAGMHPAWLLAYRGFVFLAMAWLLFQMILFRGFSAFYFYTQWTFALVIVYFAIATIISAHGCWLYSKRSIMPDQEVNRFLNGGFEQNSPMTLPLRTNKNMNVIRLQSYHEQEADEKKAGFWGHAMQLVYQTSAGAVVLTDIVFWVLLVPYLSSINFRLNVIMGCMHSLNAVFLLLDTFLNNLPFPLFRMAYFAFWSCIYVTFQWILHARGFTWWPYPFLDLATHWAPLWYFLMALAHIPCYGLYWLIVRAKNSFCPKFLPNAFIRIY